MTDYSDKDIIILAEAISNNWIRYNDCSSDECRFCYEKIWRNDYCPHESDCPVLVAKDVLTRKGEAIREAGGKE